MVSFEVKKLKRQLNAKEKQIDKHKEKVELHRKEIEKKDEEHKKELEKHKKRLLDLQDEKRMLKRVVKKHTDSYMMEMRKALSTAILAAFAFLMALSWREYISEVIDSLMTYSPAQGKFVSAVFVTIISVLGIILVTKLLGIKRE